MDETKDREALGPEEVEAALDPTVGGGSPDTAPHVGTELDGDEIIVASTNDGGDVAMVTRPGTLSGKLKLVALLQVLGGATLTLLAILFPDALSPEAWVAVGVWVQAVLGAFAAFWGSPGEVVPDDGDIAGV